MFWLLQHTKQYIAKIQLTRIGDYIHYVHVSH
uniref:Uncharacterized protein n=1 Tax=Anguilla anguilla TaxID=7936 RepID=A0A0E9VTR9_ANGAN